MIRREMQFPGEQPQWLLISQVEHARLSGVLAEHSRPHLPEAVCEELLQAIVHHDDGWAAWEAKRQIDREFHRPPSFRELPIEVSLPIWTASIEATAALGPLAAWCVAGHFLALLSSSDKLAKSAAPWRKAMIAHRTEWLAAWQAKHPTRHTLAVADQALRWLQLFDVMSLWLCSACPGQDEQFSQPPDDYQVGAGEALETCFSYQQDRPCIKPWRFDAPSLQLEAAGWLVPICEYANAEELFAARKNHSVRWQLDGQG